MKHLGDIALIDGAAIPPVDIITGGSPCQDLSVAGKRAGLTGERSGLFMHQIRVVREMREATHGKKPRYMLWENVPGALTSKKGEDFRAVLEETVRIADPEANIPRPPAGRWPHAGCIVGDGYSLAYRIHDAQFWGVPQRRKRLCLVADFDGSTAGRLLFELQRKAEHLEGDEAPGRTGTGGGLEIHADRGGLSGYPAPDGKAREEAARDNGSRPTEAGGAIAYGISSYSSNAMLSDNPHSGVYVADTMRTLDLNGGNPTCNQGGIVVIQEDPIICLQGSMIGRQEKNGPQGDGINEDISYTLNATDQHAVVIPINTMVGTRGGDERRTCLGIGNDDDPQYTLSAEHSHAVMMYEATPPLVFDARGNGNGRICPTLTGDHQSRVTDYTALCIGNGQTNQGVSPTCGTLNCMHDSQAVKAKANCDYRADSETYIAQYGIARRLTPLECERLQGFPDGWTDIGDWIDSKGKRRKAADTPRYKALGNAIALPFWEWLAARMTWQLKLSGTLKPTMGSLFDGIGGFPLAFSRAGTVPVWASEIEEFAIAVTKIRFPETERKEIKT